MATPPRSMETSLGRPCRRHWGPNDSEVRGLSAGRLGAPAQGPHSEFWAGGCAWHLSFLSGLFQELVLLRGDSRCLVPCTERHLSSASATELPLAHELPGKQVSEAVAEK
jgi:hypothetical protein